MIKHAFFTYAVVESFLPVAFFHLPNRLLVMATSVRFKSTFLADNYFLFGITSACKRRMWQLIGAP